MGASTFFQGGTIDNVAGKIGGLSAARFSLQGASGDRGSYFQVTFKAKSAGETELTLQRILSSLLSRGQHIPAGPSAD